MDKPNWSTKETLTSLKDVLLLGKVALAEFIGKFSPSAIDTRHANALNGDEDE